MLDTNSGSEGSQTAVGSAFVTQVMSNAEKRNAGVELGVEVKVTPTISLNALGNFGQYIYRNNPNVYFASDAVGVLPNGKVYQDFGKAYLKNYKQGGTPKLHYLLVPDIEIRNTGGLVLTGTILTTVI